MSAYFLTASATLMCPHGGLITIKPQSTPILFVDKSAVLTTADALAVKQDDIACPNTQAPCTGIQWTNTATAVKENGTAILLQTKQTGDADAQAIPPVAKAPQVTGGVKTSASGA
jgi:hypothetical protein